jgi:hypothetical protein
VCTDTGARTPIGTIEISCFAKLCHLVSSYFDLFQVVSNCVKLCQVVSSCVKFCQVASSCVKLCQVVPIGGNISKMELLAAIGSNCIPQGGIGSYRGQ